MNILYAEDEVDIAEMVLAILDMDGHNCFHCSNGELAYQQLINKPNYYDLLITDHMMPELNGVDLVTRLRIEGITIPVIINTASPHVKDLLSRVHILKLNNNVRLLPKPMDIDQLTNAVKEFTNDDKNKSIN